MGKQKPLIVLVVGHTAQRPGAFAVPPISIHEYTYNKSLAAIIAEAIRPNFEFVVIYRDGMTIVETYQKIGKLKPDANIELHFNSTDNEMAFGTETLCSEKDVPFAMMIQTALCDGLKRTKGNRGVKVLKTKEDRGFMSVSLLRVPSVIIEPFFGSSPSDAALGLKSMQVIADSINKALNVWFHWDSDGSE